MWANMNIFFLFFSTSRYRLFLLHWSHLFLDLPIPHLSLGLYLITCLIVLYLPFFQYVNMNVTYLYITQDRRRQSFILSPLKWPLDEAASCRCDEWFLAAALDIVCGCSPHHSAMRSRPHCCPSLWVSLHLFFPPSRVTSFLLLTSVV